MRKIVLALISAAALVAFLGLSAPAFALTDPDCDGDPYNNDPVVHEFNIAMTDNDEAGAVSGLRGGGLACGTNVTQISKFDPDGGRSTIYDNAKVLTGRGVVVNNTAKIANERFVGSVRVNVAGHGLLGGPHIYGVGKDDLDGPPEGINSVLRIDSLINCDNESPVGGDVPGEVIACYKGTNALGYNYNWITAGKDGRNWLTIGPFHPALGISGLTRIHEFNLCGYVGASEGTVFPDDCGSSSDPFLQKNGDISDWPEGYHKPDCNNGNGIYTVTATRRDGVTTPEASTCVLWKIPRFPYPKIPYPETYEKQ